MNYPFFKPSSYTFFSREAILSGGTDYPKMLNVEPTNICNFDCVMCSRCSSQAPLGMMSLDLFRSIIDDAVSFRREIVWLTLHNDGEPLLHPKLPAMIQYAKNSGAVRYVHFNTNGQLLTEEVAEALIDSGLDDLTVSIDAVTDETFAAVKRAGDLATVVGNTLGLMDLKKKLKKPNPWVRAKIIDMDITHGEIDDFVRYWQPRADEVQVQAIHNAGGALAVNNGCSPETRYPCSLPWYAMAIKWNGLVVPCCVDLSCENILGDLRREKLQDVFRNGMEIYREKMTLGLEQELNPCCNCNVWRNGVNIFESI